MITRMNIIVINLIMIKISIKGRILGIVSQI